MDPEDAIAKVLEPGEKIVWSDRPHRAGRAFVRTLRDEWWLLLIASPLFAYALLGAGLLAVAGPVTLVVATAIVFARRVTIRLADRYFSTDKGRLFVFAGGSLDWAQLPRAELITTKATGTDEFGDVHLGTTVVLHDVSYPLLAVETLRGIER